VIRARKTAAQSAEHRIKPSLMAHRLFQQKAARILEEADFGKTEEKSGG
jgi:hypothetical protein